MEQLVMNHLSKWNGIWRRYLDATTTAARAKVLSDYKKCIQHADQNMECEGCICGADACPGCKDCTSADVWREIESLEPVEITSIRDQAIVNAVLADCYASLVDERNKAAGFGLRTNPHKFPEYNSDFPCGCEANLYYVIDEINKRGIEAAKEYVSVICRNNDNKVSKNHNCIWHDENIRKYYIPSKSKLTKEELTVRVKNARTRIGEKVRDEWVPRIVDDILRIVNDGFRYKPRTNTHEFRIPEDLSTRYAEAWFCVNAYEKN